MVPLIKQLIKQKIMIPLTNNIIKYVMVPVTTSTIK